MHILTEASGSLTSGYLIQAIQTAGHKAVTSDIDSCAGEVLGDDFILMPRASDSHLWDKLPLLLKKHSVEMVIPSLDESLLGWAEHKNLFSEKYGVFVLISDSKSIALCQDKWLTYQFFKERGIPTPETSLEPLYPLSKPRLGRGGKGVLIGEKPKSMEGLISQEFLSGQEYTIDVFCDSRSNPVYIIPRKRMRVIEGKSTQSQTHLLPELIDWTRKICAALPFIGPVNIQCFVSPEGRVHFTEINPRIAGGMALAFAASENWIELSVNHFKGQQPIQPKPIQDGLKMYRYYAEVFAS